MGNIYIFVFLFVTMNFLFWIYLDRIEYVDRNTKTKFTRIYYFLYLVFTCLFLIANENKIANLTNIYKYGIDPIIINSLIIVISFFLIWLIWYCIFIFPKTLLEISRSGLKFKDEYEAVVSENEKILTTTNKNYENSISAYSNTFNLMDEILEDIFDEEIGIIDIYSGILYSYKEFRSRSFELVICIKIDDLKSVLKNEFMIKKDINIDNLFKQSLKSDITDKEIMVIPLNTSFYDELIYVVISDDIIVKGEVDLIENLIYATDIMLNSNI